MKTKKLLALILSSLLLVGCNNEPVDYIANYESNEFVEPAKVKGALGAFDLIGPSNESILSEDPTFSWNASENAVSYTLEVCSHPSFEHESSSIVYAKETNISTTSFTLSAPLKLKNSNYYWRVTAINTNNTNSVGKEKLCNNVFSFYYESLNVDEIPIDIGESGDWQLHKEGSYADINIDKTNFFDAEDPNSLVISFDEEHTKQGIESSDGWIVVSKVLEQDFYGTDSILFNFYYSGNDADILIRFVDHDGEYWFNEVKISQNAKQKVLMKFSEFTLRTKDTTVQNEVFNFEHMQFIEIVFEKSFGDGVCAVGNFRAVNYDSYSDLFLTKMNFNSYPKEKWVHESYIFGETILDGGNELQLDYSTSPMYGNEKGIGSYSYGYSKVPLDCYFGSGNALHVSVKYTGYSSNDAKAYIRIYEEDTDRWSYDMPFSSLKKDEFVELTIPFTAFAKSEIRGDGNRQFYYILQLQLGGAGLYGTGSLSFKDIEIVTIPDVSTNPIVVSEDGMIENFDGYTNRTQTYQHWESSIDNKDEGIFINTTNKYYDGVNKAAGQFNYKSDMFMATYDTYLNSQNYKTGNGIKFWLKDGSVIRSGDPAIDAEKLTNDDVKATVVLQIALKDGRWYRYTIEHAPARWTQYELKFSDFELNQGVVVSDSVPVVSEYIVNFAFGLQYFYYAKGVAHPIYTESNPVYFDNISFVNIDETKITALEKELHPSADKNTYVDNFEYSTQEELRTHWFGLNGFDYEKVELSNVVSPSGGTHSMKLDYKKGSNSPSYAYYPAFGSDVKARAMQVDIKSDGAATIYINLYILIGTNTVQFRHTISTSSDKWNHYLIGFDSSLFANISGGTQAISNSMMPNIQRITFGVVGSGDPTVSSIYVDNLVFDGKANSYSVHTITPLED